MHPPANTNQMNTGYLPQSIGLYHRVRERERGTRPLSHLGLSRTTWPSSGRNSLGSDSLSLVWESVEPPGLSLPGVRSEQQIVSLHFGPIVFHLAFDELKTWVWAVMEAYSRAKGFSFKMIIIIPRH